MEPVETTQNVWLWADVYSPVAILISAFGAWWFARASIKNARDIARKKSTFDYLSKLSWDRDYIKAKNKFLEIRLGPKKLRAVSEEYHRLKDQGRIHNGATDVDNDEVHRLVEDHSAIKNILNEYEALAIAVKAEALDEEMIKKNIRQQFLEHVDSCNEFISHTRKNAGVKAPDKIWCELQSLAERWRF